MDAVNESLANIGRLQRTLLEILFHEGFIGFGGGFGQTVADLLERPRQIVSVKEVDHRVGVGGCSHGHAVHAECVADRGDGLGEIGIVLVEPGDHKGDGSQTAILAVFPCAAGADLYPRGGINGDQREIGGTYGPGFDRRIHESG